MSESATEQPCFWRWLIVGASVSRWQRSQSLSGGGDTGRRQLQALVATWAADRPTAMCVCYDYWLNVNGKRRRQWSIAMTFIHDSNFLTTPPSFPYRPKLPDSSPFASIYCITSCATNPQQIEVYSGVWAQSFSLPVPTGRPARWPITAIDHATYQQHSI